MSNRKWERAHPGEAYLRAVVLGETGHPSFKRGPVELIMGLGISAADLTNPELDNGAGETGHAYLRTHLKLLGRHALNYNHTTDWDLGNRAAALIHESFPDRTFFVEVQHEDPDEGWVQIVTPQGWPPKREEPAATVVFKPGKPIHPIPAMTVDPLGCGSANCWCK